MPIETYARPARWIHWLTALAGLFVIPAGFIMMNMPSGPGQDRLFDLHRSVGTLILALAVCGGGGADRLRRAAPSAGPSGLAMADRQFHSPSALCADLVMPLLGWGASSAFGASVSVFGLFTLPNLVPKNEAMSEVYGGAHETLAFLMCALLAAHIGAALYHGFVKRDGRAGPHGALAGALNGFSRAWREGP